MDHNKRFIVCAIRLSLLILMILPLIVLDSCKCKYQFQQEILIPKSNWDTSQIIRFNWQIEDTSSWYNLNLQLKHSLDLSYQNLYVKSSTRFPDQTTKEQILSFELFDQSGKPTGNCSCDKCETEIELLPKFKFPGIGSYDLSLEQFSRDTSISGIHSFELRLTKLSE